MKQDQIFLSLNNWRSSLTFAKLLPHLLASFGAMWTLSEIISFFSSTYKDWLYPRWWLFLIIGVIWTIYVNRPKTSFRSKINGRDVTIEIKVTDAFCVPGALVVPMNNLYDPSLGGHVINAKSIQGKLLRDYYDGVIDHMDLDIQKQLAAENVTFQEESDGKTGVIKKYDIGSVVQVSKKGKTFYLLALTDVSKERRAVCSEEYLLTSLPKLWYYISEQCDKGEIVTPLLGTGNARLPIKREQVVREIIRSFIASCSSKTFCEKLTIVVHPKDVINNNIDLADVYTFLDYSCKYAEFKNQPNHPVGTGIGSK